MYYLGHLDRNWQLVMLYKPYQKCQSTAHEIYWDMLARLIEIMWNDIEVSSTARILEDSLHWTKGAIFSAILKPIFRDSDPALVEEVLNSIKKEMGIQSYEELAVKWSMKQV